jgi:hypothetical protein
MKQRFAVTLLAVAIASLSASAFAIAPVISDFRSPIISDDTPVTNSNVFVYLDVFDLNTKATDPDATVTPANIIWSFTEATGTYRINNRQSIIVGTDNPNAPGVKGVGVTGQDDITSGSDTNVRTITFRNQILSPVGGPNTDPAGPDGVLDGTSGKPNHTRVLTLYASDGSSYTTKSFLVYTRDGGNDALSGKSTTSVLPLTTPGTAGVSGWTTFNLVGTTTFTSGANGLCITVPAAGDNFGGWISPYGANGGIPLVKNNVYRVRLDVAGVPSIAQAATPLWDFVFENIDNTAQFDQQKFSTDLIIWDTFGGANAAGPTAGDHSYDIWWAPLSVQATDWNDPTTGEFAAANEAFNDVRLEYRVLDVTGAVDAGADSGTLCVRTYQIDRIDLADLTVGASVYDNQTLTAANSIVGAFGGIGTGTNQTTVVYAGGDVTITPATPGGSWNTEIVTLDVGNGVITPASEIPDNWPVPWVTDQLLMSTAGIQAANATGQTNPPDAVRMMMDAPTSELGIDSMVLAGANSLGLPKTAAATVYTLFFHTNTRTLSGVVEHRGLRPRVSLICVPSILSGGQSVNNGGITVTFIRTQTVDVSGL